MPTKHVKKKKRKDAYPKKVRHTPTKRVKKKAHTKKDYKREREIIHIKEFLPPSTKNMHTLAHLNQGL